MQLQFELEFLSDWHIGAGHGTADGTDSAIERDPDNIPIITGSTLKGLFRDALLKLESLESTPDIAGDTLADQLLGRPNLESRFRFRKARPIAFPELTSNRQPLPDDFTVIVPGVRVDPCTRRAEDAKLFQKEMGARSLAFHFTVDGTGEATVEDAMWLVAAARMIRRLGGGRRRGAGACRIRLTDPDLQVAYLDGFEQVLRGQSPSLPAAAFAQPLVDDLSLAATGKRFRLILLTEEPVVISERPLAGNAFTGKWSIPGSALRGAIASRARPNTLSEDEYRVFCDLFIHGGVSFQSALPLHLTEDKSAGYIIDAVPSGIVKNPEDDTIRSVLDPETPVGYKRYSKRHVTGHGLQRSELQRLSRVHVQIDPETQRASDGDLYSYDAIPTGTHLMSEITLDENTAWADLAQLADLPLRQPFDLYLGRALSRGYGYCRVWLEPLATNAPPLACPVPLEVRRETTDDGTLYLTLVSDTIIVDAWGRAVRQFEDDWLSAALGVSVSVRSQVVTPVTVEGWDARSGMPKWRDTALAKGSSVRLELNDTGGLAQSLAEVERIGIGLRRNEGFGRVVFNHLFHTTQNQADVESTAIPDVLRQPDLGGATRTHFLADWEAILNEHLQVHYFTSEPYRALAYFLYESPPPNEEAAVQYLRNELGNNPYREKDNRYNAAAMRHLSDFFLALADPQMFPADYWNEGVRMLARRLMTLVKQVES